MAILIRHKRGDTFIASVTYTDEEGEPIDLLAEGFSVKSQVLINNRRYPLECAIADPQDDVDKGRVEISGASSTWPIGEALWDVEFTQAGTPPYVWSTPTQQMLIEEEITQ